MKEEKKEEITSDSRVQLSRGMRFTIFVILIIIQGAINISSGLLSSASKQIKLTMNLNNKEYGMFGTANGMGRIVGSLGYMIIVNSVSRKWTLVTTLLVKGLTHIFFSMSNNLWVMITLRGLLGIEHVPLMIYIPVWIDQFGIQKYKTFFMTMVQVIVPIGKVTGYLFHIQLGDNNWKFGFVIEAIVLFAAMVFFICTPEKFFSSNLVVVTDAEGEDQVQKKSMRVVSIFEAKQTGKKEQKSSFGTELADIFTRPVYVVCLFIRAIVFGVNTAIHYWIGDYMRTVLMVEGTKVFGAYTLIAISGPLGGLFAGTIMTIIIGGYQNKHSSIALIVSMALACGCGIASPFFDSIMIFSILNTLYFVFNSVVQPLIQGIILTSVKPENKGTAFSIANFSTMLTTSGPFPFFYGAINDYYKDTYPWMAYFCIMFLASVSILPMILMAILRYRDFAAKDNALLKGQNLNRVDEEDDKNEEDIELQNKK